MTIPEIIRHAINRRQCLVSNPLSPNSAIGQLRIVTKETPSGVIRRTVLVAGVNMENRTSIIMMTHPYEDLATDTDVVIPAGFEGVPYAIVVQTDCMGVFWTADLNKLEGEYVAEIGSDAVNQIRNLSHDSSYASDISFVNSFWGTALQDCLFLFLSLHACRFLLFDALRLALDEGHLAFSLEFSSLHFSYYPWVYFFVRGHIIPVHSLPLHLASVLESFTMSRHL